MKRIKPRVGKTVKTAERTSGRPGTASGKLIIPPILLEGDESAPSPITGPGPKYSVGPGPAAEQATSGPGELPEAYGTGRVLLLARDPHCLYASWDLTAVQQRHLNSRSSDGHLVLRVHREQAAGPIVAEVLLHPEARHGFIDVPTAGANFVVELGYYGMNRQQWLSVAISGRVTTPHATVSEHKTAQFAIMPAGPPRPTPATAPSLPDPAGTPTLRTPPRVSWIPALGVDPSGTSGDIPEFLLGFQALASMESLEQQESFLFMQSISEESTLAQERALKGMLGAEFSAQAALSSVGTCQ